MAKPTSPSVPHTSDAHPYRHVDIRGTQGKIHHPVQNDLGATAIGAFQRASVRDAQGRK